MNCLYKVTSKFTLEEYRRFNNTIMRKKYLMVASIVAILLILTGGILLHSLPLILFALIYPILFFGAAEIGVRRVFNSNKLLQNMEITYEFYDDYIYEKHDGGEEKVPYEKLADIIETKTNFYLMIAKNQGFVISKENMPEGLGDFLRGKRQK